MTGVSTCRRGRRTVYAIHIAVNHFFSTTARSNESCRRERLEVMGGGGANGCQGASCSEA